MALAGNPFKKDQFPSYRDWEEVLFLFLATQLKDPDVEEWNRLAQDPSAKEHAAFMSLQAANFAHAKKLPSEQKLLSVYPTLMNEKPSLSRYKDWVSKRWCDENRLVHGLQFALDHHVSVTTHRLVA